MRQSDKRKVTILQPDFSEGNQYINNIRSVLESLGYEVIRAKDILDGAYMWERIETANLNWYENVDGTGFRKYVKFLAKAAFLPYLKWLRKCRIAVTVHNKFSHDSANRKLSVILLRWSCIHADKIIILCTETRQYLKQLFAGRMQKQILQKCFFIPHPNYIGDYPREPALLRKSGFRIPVDSKLNLLFFGFMKPYKNIELLVRLADRVRDREIRIIIAGGGDRIYMEGLKREIGARDNILLFPEFIPDDQIWSVINASDCVILPYHMETVLNSGACILSFSVGKNVIAPMIGTMREFPPELVYGYVYDREESHANAVYGKVCQVYEEYKDRKDVFYEKQRRLKEIVSEKNSKELVRERYKKLYEMMEQGK